MSRDFFGTHSCWISTQLSLGFTALAKVEIYRFLFVTWPLEGCVTWLYWWGPLILSHHTAKFGSIVLVKMEIYRFLFVTWLQYWIVTWLCGWGPPILSDHPAKFGVHRPYGTENNGVCNISSNSNSISNSNSNAEVPMVYKWPEKFPQQVHKKVLKSRNDRHLIYFIAEVLHYFIIHYFIGCYFIIFQCLVKIPSGKM